MGWRGNLLAYRTCSGEQTVLFARPLRRLFFSGLTGRLPVAEINTLVVWRLGRLGRSLQHLIETMTRWQEQGIGFKSLTESMDTTTPGGVLIFHVFGALAQFERDLIRERARAGLAAARAR